MKKITIAILALVSIMSFSSFKVSADEPEQYAEYWEPAITEYIAGSTYSFDLTNNKTSLYIENDTAYAQAGAYSEVGYCNEFGNCYQDDATTGAGLAHSFIDYYDNTTRTWQESSPR